MTALDPAHKDSSGMTAPLAFTLDLEDHRPDDRAEQRYPAVVEALLDDLEAWGTTATIFVVGGLVDESPALIAEARARGHEIGLHGAAHAPLPEVGPDRFRSETAKATEALAGLLGKPVAGFRAPIFSLVPESAWAPEILLELGYAYSSSVLPAANPLYGWPGAPRRPFRWPCGLVELPAPTFGVGPVRLPLLGGTYLRTAPWLAVRAARRRAQGLEAPWIYAHPYDFDPAEPRWVVPEVGRLGSRLLWLGRAGMAERVRRLAAGSRVTMADLAAACADAEVFHRVPEGSGQAQSNSEDDHAARRRHDHSEDGEYEYDHSEDGEYEYDHSEDGEYGQDDMVHELPRAALVDRVDWLVERCRGRRVIHVGFADAGCRDEQDQAGRWLHARLTESASELVGLDADAASVDRAVSEGYEAYEADCTDRAAVEALGLAPAEVVVAGEVIEHVGSPGPFLEGLQPLCALGGRLIVTTPNAGGLVNAAAALARGVEVNHPDHVVMFTWRTLTELMRRHGWRPLEAAVYVPVPRGRGRRSRLEWLGMRSVLGAERMLSRLGRPFAADGLIVVAELSDPAASASASG